MAGGRTQEVAVSEVRFGVAYGELNERIWSHFDTALSLVQVLAGMLAVAGLLADPTIIKWAGGGLAIVSAVQLVLTPRMRSVDFRDARIRFQELLGRSWTLEPAALEIELEKVKASSRPGLRALLRPAYNIVAEQLGARDALYPLTAVERFATVLAW